MAGASLIEAYLEQLRTQLPRTADRDDVIAEVEDHLHTIVEAHLSLGLSEEAATRHALAGFGSADLVSRAFAQQKGDTTAMPSTFSTYSGLATIVGGTILGLCLALGSVTTLDVGTTNAWFGPFAATGGILTVIGLLGIHARHRALYGVAGRIGRVLVPVGAVGTIVCAATWFEPGILVFEIATVLGLVALGSEVWRGGVLARGAVALSGLGLAGLLSANLIGTDPVATWSFSAIVAIVAVTLVGGGLAWLGYGLWRERALLTISGGGQPTATA